MELGLPKPDLEALKAELAVPVPVEPVVGAEPSERLHAQGQGLAGFKAGRRARRKGARASGIWGSLVVMYSLGLL